MAFYETLKASYFFTKPFFAMQNFKKGFVVEGSSRVSAGRTFKGSLELKIRFLSIFTHFQVYGTFFQGFVKNLFFLEWYHATSTKQY